MNITHEYTCTLKLDQMCSIMFKKLKQHLDFEVTEPMQCTMPREGYLLNLTYKSKPWMHLLSIAT